MLKPLVSVICITYNHEKYIRQTLEGFIMQRTTFPFEIIVHDDASTDSTADIIREYVAKYPELIVPVYQNQNQYSKGIWVTRTFCLPLVKGKYIAFCEGDDYWTDPRKLEIQFDFMEQNPDYSMCCHNTLLINNHTGEQEINSDRGKDCDISFCEIADWLRQKRQHINSSFIRREFIMIPEWMLIGISEDFYYFLNCALNGKIFFINRVMSVYRRYTPGSITSTISYEELNIENENIIEVLKRADKFSAYFHTRHIYNAICNRLYDIAYRRRKWELISYNNYMGKKKKYDLRRSFMLYKNLYLIPMIKKVPIVYRLLSFIVSKLRKIFFNASAKTM